MTDAPRFHGAEDESDEVLFFGDKDIMPSEPESELESEPMPAPSLSRRSLSPRAWGQAVLPALVGYGVGLAIAAVAATVLLNVLGIEQEQADIPETPYAGLLPAHLVAMAFFGTATNSKVWMLETSGDGAVGWTSTYTIPLLPLTIIICAAIFLSTRWLAKRYQVRLAQTIALSAITGISLALLVGIVATAFPSSSQDQSSMFTTTTWSGGMRTWIGAFALAFLTSWFTWLAYSGIWSTWMQRVKILAHNAMRVAALHLAFLVVVSAAIGMVAMSGDEMFDFVGQYGPGGILPMEVAMGLLINLGGYTALLGSFGAIDVSQTNEMVYVADPQNAVGQSGEVSGGTMTFMYVDGHPGIPGYLSDEPSTTTLFPGGEASLFAAGVPGLLYATVAIAFIACIAASFLLAARREGERPGLVSGIVTIVVYAAMGLVLQLALRIALGLTNFDGQNSFESITTLAPAGWTFALFGAWGAAVEIMARVFPPVIRRLSPAALMAAQTLSGVDRPSVTTGEPIDSRAEPGVPEPGGGSAAPDDLSSSDDLRPLDASTAQNDLGSPGQSSLAKPAVSREEFSSVLDYQTSDEDLDLFRPPPRSSS